MFCKPVASIWQRAIVSKISVLPPPDSSAPITAVNLHLAMGQSPDYAFLKT